ncbi:MAG: dihydropteroate synthase [Campylobacterales bacterium]|nr:dihydropteroate synthase [Campylobacterales bacterium]
MYVERLSNTLDAKAHLHALGVDGGGVGILASKMRLYFLKIHRLHVGAANILKQDALSIGADLAVPRGTVIAQSPYVDAILIASAKQLKLLSRKEKTQPFGLKQLAQELDRMMHAYEPKAPKVMGIVNANEDSFYHESRALRAEEALRSAERMIEEGADMIDLGAVSTRPGSEGVSEQEELSRVRPVIECFYKAKLFERAQLSIDSFTPSVVVLALDHGFEIVNDITGLEDERICALCAEYKAMAVIMHMQGRPKQMQHAPFYEDVIAEVGGFFEERIAKAKRFGIERLVLDVGIGFGKRLQDNAALIAQLRHFLALGYPLLVGASRKSMIDQIDPSRVEERLGGSIAAHLRAVQNGAEIIRVHDVRAHVQAIKVWRALEG